MSDTATATITGLASVLVAAIIVGGLTYSCSEARQSYYSAQRVCVQAGGSWVPSNAAGDALCINARPTLER